MEQSRKMMCHQTNWKLRSDAVHVEGEKKDNIVKYIYEVFYQETLLTNLDKSEISKPDTNTRTHTHVHLLTKDDCVTSSLLLNIKQQNNKKRTTRSQVRKYLVDINNIGGDQGWRMQDVTSTDVQILVKFDRVKKKENRTNQGL